MKIIVDASFYKEINGRLAMIAKDEKENVVLVSSHVHFDCFDARRLNCFASRIFRLYNGYPIRSLSKPIVI